MSGYNMPDGCTTPKQRLLLLPIASICCGADYTEHWACELLSACGHCGYCPICGPSFEEDVMKLKSDSALRLSRKGGRR